ncbi:D-erythronate dehydrogenase [Algihabitans albus]|uniref:D-erythronate dehydrogenase n=1 Tax=Algihabitans albus TaxID=2164067 RepID=UPI001F328A11|nr:D-erythronate dehydrogenase [Algihabitans albus]
MHMKVLIIGAGGMIGRKLSERLVREGRVAGRSIDEMTLVDVTEPTGMKPTRVEPTGRGGPTVKLVTRALDFTAKGAAVRLIDDRPDIIFHLAAIVSGEAESDFEKGYRINVDGTRDLFEAIRKAQAADGYRPRVIFASSIAVFGAPFPSVIPDSFHSTPLTSYGTQKAIGELLLTDYTRRGFMDGIGIRLPTIVIRPGRPNKAASGFFSNILREPINGQEAVLPVSEDVRHWFASPRAAVEFFVHAAGLDPDAVGPHRNLNMPGLSTTVGEEIEALGRVMGADVPKLIRREPDEAIRRIVQNWATGFEPSRARTLGFRAETSFDEIIRVYLEDELGTGA